MTVESYFHIIVDSRHRNLLALKEMGAEVMLSPTNNLVCRIGKLGFNGQYSRERGGLCIGSKQTHKSANTVHDWRRHQSGFNGQLQSCRKRLIQCRHGHESAMPWYFNLPQAWRNSLPQRCIDLVPMHAR